MPDLKTELQKVGAAINATEPKKKRPAEQDRQKQRALATPFYVRALVEKIGANEAGAAIGYTATSLLASLRTDSISMTAEVAAKGVLREMGDILAECHAILICRVSPDKIKAFEAVAQAMDIKITEI